MINITQEFRRLKRWVSNQALELKWYFKARKLLEDVPEKDYNLFETVLRNQYNYNEYNKQYSHCEDNDQLDVLLFVAKQFLTSLNARHLVAVQPMNSPVGLTYMLQYTETESDEESQLEGFAGKRLTLEIVQQTVEAGTRKLQTRVDPSLIVDLKTMHDIDVKKEMSMLIGYSIADEVTREILADLRALGKKEKGLHKELPRSIRSACTFIAQRSKRGAGNWIVINSKMFDRLKEETKSEGTFEGREDNGMTVLPLVGTFTDTIKVYIDDEAPDNEILLGYKGGNGETDAGYFFNPYVPVLTSGKVQDAETGEIVETLMTRYGKTAQFKTEIRDESHYYTVLTVE